jgi:hypothetical protein
LTSQKYRLDQPSSHSSAHALHISGVEAKIRAAQWGESTICAGGGEATQVELHGHYTIANLKAFETYHATTSWLRALLVCVLAPLPCVVVIVEIHLLPLEPPTLGATKTLHFWIRTLMTGTLITYCILQQFKQHLPQLTLKHCSPVLFNHRDAGVGDCDHLHDSLVPRTYLGQQPPTREIPAPVGSLAYQHSTMNCCLFAVGACLGGPASETLARSPSRKRTTSITHAFAVVITSLSFIRSGLDGAYVGPFPSLQAVWMSSSWKHSGRWGRSVSTSSGHGSCNSRFSALSYPLREQCSRRTKVIWIIDLEPTRTRLCGFCRRILGVEPSKAKGEVNTCSNCMYREIGSAHPRCGSTNSQRIKGLTPTRTEMDD